MITGIAAQQAMIAGGTTATTVVFALIGQSNMVGRYGPVDSTLDATDTDIKMLSGGSLVTAQDPLDHFDETANTVGPGLSFAKAYRAANPGATVVLVPAADGGTGFIADHWRTGDDLYNDAVDRINEAMTLALADDPDAQFGGFLWIQGEDDIGDFGVNGDEYAAMERQLIRDMRADVTEADGDSPFVIGGLSPAWITGQTTGASVITAKAATPSLINRTGFASATSPSDIESQTGDNIHFTAAGAREMGDRLYSALVSAQSNSKAGPSYSNSPPAGDLAFHFDHVGVSDGFPIEDRGDYGIRVKNQKVHLSSGEMDFGAKGNVNVFYIPKADFAGPGSADFSLRCTGTFTDDVGNQGIIGQWVFNANRRSWLLRRSGNLLQFFYSSAGTSSSGSLSHSIVSDTEYDIEVRRVGTALQLYVDGVLRDSDTLSSGFTFFNASDDTEVGFYDAGSLSMAGTLKSLTWEWL